MQVEVVRRGGLAGIALRGEADTADLGGPQAHAAEAALKELTEREVAAQAGHPDSFQYEITYSEAGGLRRTVVLNESHVTPDLQPLLDLAIARGKLV